MFIKNGNFRPVVRLLLVLGGVGIIYLGSILSSYLLSLLGLALLGVGGYSSRASALGIKPFREDDRSGGK